MRNRFLLLALALGWGACQSTDSSRFGVDPHLNHYSKYLPQSTDLISLVEKTYDAQGRVSSEETKVINPILCTMQAGVIRYVY